MANYNYDEAGNMAAYFVISVLAIILVPATFSLFTALKPKTQRLDGCQCQPCVQRREQVRKRDSSVLKSLFSQKSLLITAGWAVVAFLTYKVVGAEIENKVYNPFEILGISTGLTEKEIRSHFRKLSRIYHPDKVKATVNQTIEEIEQKFVEITKAYKSLTDETIRRNWELYGHPDGRQEISMGIALPAWIIESKNNIWVLGVYGIIFGGALPAMVGRWWFGSRQKTKDGINAQTAAAFFKGLKEFSTPTEIAGVLSQAYKWENPPSASTHQEEVKKLEEQIEAALGEEWKEAKKVVEGKNGGKSERKALVLLYAHFLRLDVSPGLKAEQNRVVLQAPFLLNALLNIVGARSWLTPTLATMRLHAYLSQALVPSKPNFVAQLPGFSAEDELAKNGVTPLPQLASKLEESRDGRSADVKKALQSWSKLDVLSTAFKVIGERLITPSAIVFLLVKVRVRPPVAVASEKGTSETEEQRAKREDEFLNSRGDAEDVKLPTSYAHAPRWPGLRKPSWWLVLADDKTNRVVVPPMKLTEIPVSQSGASGEYRSYKLQFQAPPQVGLFTWKVSFVSDTFVGEEVQQTIVMKIDDVSALNADEQGAEDEISDPEEDSLAGQMAAMRGGSVKQPGRARDSDEESSTDDDEEGPAADDSSDDDD
ncbi:translocation protein sec63 [Coniophora puteana RWD-64-598 SS2]|uniref:Translocation protein sec63 n=1 Tax=Coniophora puteana (strain RWD-64-598) TaxID=741705 RepID=A0A5M3MTW6_CONPW|nr:translocation protein sec63 [Coniophora puteana RWD-64-598 SS2]EIW81991.1 translocation protein sec63 [Coniophora puteana RWD-64-598 SS2]